MLSINNVSDLRPSKSQKRDSHSLDDRSGSKEKKPKIGLDSTHDNKSTDLSPFDYKDVVESTGYDNRAKAMLRQGLADMKSKNFGSMNIMISYMSRYNRSSAFRDFMHIAPMSQEVQNGIDLALQSSVSESNYETTKILLSYGANPCSTIDWPRAVDYAELLKDDSPESNSVFQLLSQKPENAPT